MVNSSVLKIFSSLILCFILCIGCIKNSNKEINEEFKVTVEPQEIFEFGFNLNDYVVKRDTIKKGDSFGEILERNNIGYPHIFQIAEKAKDTFDIRKLQVGKPYTLLCTKGDSLEKPKCFIYQPNKEEYVVINFQDSIHAYTSRKPIKYVEKEVTGVITSNISEALDEQGVSVLLAYEMSDIYAWTIDFFRLQKNDKFKVNDLYVCVGIWEWRILVKKVFCLLSNLQLPHWSTYNWVAVIVTKLIFSSIRFLAISISISFAEN